MTETVSLTEAARRTGISRRTLGRMIATGRLDGTRTASGGYEVRLDALDALSSAPKKTENDLIAQKDTYIESLLAQIETLKESNTELDKRAAVAEAIAKEREGLPEIITALSALLNRQQFIDVTTSATDVTSQTSEPYSEPKRRKGWRRRD